MKIKYGRIIDAEGYASCGTSRFEKKDAEYLLLAIKKVMDAHNVVFMPAYGTLLGIIRQNDFIPGDHDMDVIIYGNDAHVLWNVIPEFEALGVKFVRCVEPYIYTFAYGTADCDFYALLDDAAWPINKRYYIVQERYIQKDFFAETQKVEFLGAEFDVPKNPERLLEYYYGKSWRIPQKGAARVESYVFVHRYAMRFMQKCVRYIKRHWLKK